MNHWIWDNWITYISRSCSLILWSMLDPNVFAHFHCDFMICTINYIQLPQSPHKQKNQNFCSAKDQPIDSQNKEHWSPGGYGSIPYNCFFVLTTIQKRTYIVYLGKLVTGPESVRRAIQQVAGNEEEEVPTDGNPLGLVEGSMWKSSKNGSFDPNIIYQGMLSMGLLDYPVVGGGAKELWVPNEMGSQESMESLRTIMIGDNHI